MRNYGQASEHRENPGKKDGGRGLSEAVVAGYERTAKQLVEATWIPAGATEEEMRTRIGHAYRLMQQLAPQDANEEMLSAQIVAAHGAAMEWMRRAMDPDQPYAVVDGVSKLAEKWMSLFLRQLMAFDKHRGKGQQKVVVEHIHMERGAQAVFGGHYQAPRDVTPFKHVARDDDGQHSTRRNAHEKD